MHPCIQQKLTGTRVAEIRSQAERQRIARAARRATRRPAAQPVAGPVCLLHQVLPALLTAYGRPRQHGALAAQAPQGQRT